LDGVCHTTEKTCPLSEFSPISTGLVMWWFGIMVAMPPVEVGHSNAD